MYSTIWFSAVCLISVLFGHLKQTVVGIARATRGVCYSYEEIVKRDKLSLDLFNIKVLRTSIHYLRQTYLRRKLRMNYRPHLTCSVRSRHGYQNHLRDIVHTGVVGLDIEGVIDER